MFDEEELQKILEKNTISQDAAIKLLTLYLGPADWKRALGTFYQRLRKKIYDEEDIKTHIREAIAFAIMLPVFDRSAKIDLENPENLLFWGHSFHQFDKRDWFKELQNVVEKDAHIAEWRKEALSLGIIYPIDYQPYTRQAFKWMCDEAENSEVELTSELKDKFAKLVMAYGGAVISYIFMKHKDRLKKNAVNWRSGYFLERTIFDVYTKEQVLQIKKQELQRTNPKWVKTLQTI